jgi:sulfate transport system ATP-binding protein
VVSPAVATVLPGSFWKLLAMSILAKNITKRFGTFTALDNVTVQADGGKLVALLGPSGSGKTTLLRIIAGLEFPDAGQILFEGEDATDRSARHRNVGFVFQHYALFRHMSIFENVAFSLRVRKRPKEETAVRVRELLKLVQLENFEKRYPSQLSGGQRQRVALARALAAQPKVLLLDEPFGALDAQVRKELRRWLRKLHDEIHVTSLFVTHDQEEALEVADEVVIFNKGRVEQVGTPDEVYNKPANPFVLSFLGHVNIFHGRVHEGQARLADGSSLSARTAGSDDELQDGDFKVYVRPHEIDILPIPEGQEEPPAPGSASQGQLGRVSWVHRAGASVKVEVELEGSGQVVVAELPRTRYAELNLERGQRVYVRSRDARIFSADFQI